ncbi:MAG: ABC transporter permease [Clostridiales bacterium]|nr:ABC transporter permease [Clostridiales bacterium]
MYQLTKMNAYKTLRDRTFWILIGICLLIELWVYVPRAAFDVFVYTGADPKYNRYLEFFKRKVATNPTLIDDVLRRGFTLPTLSFFASYSFVFCGRERKSRLFENLCAIRRDRTEVFFANLLWLVLTVIPFLLINQCMLAIASKISAPEKTVGDVSVLFPYYFSVFVVAAFFASLTYSVYMLSHSSVLPVGIYVFFSTISLFHPATADVPVLGYITKLDLIDIVHKLAEVRTWKDCFNLSIWLIPVIIVSVLVSAFVVQKRDLK